MRTLLVYNPNATTTTRQTIDRITDLLSRKLDLEIEATKRRDHAGFLSAGAAHEGFDLVLAMGGDGTVNEVIQGLARTDVRLGILPGGSTNVWARALGLPNDAEAAAHLLLERLAEKREREVNLGEADDRYFCFAAGLGYDAEVVRAVERRYRLKRTVRQASFLWCGLWAYLGGYDRDARITVSDAAGVSSEPLRSVVVCNSNPFTYLGPWPARVCPGADLENGLAATGVRTLSLPALARLAERAFRGGDITALPFTRTWTDQAVLTLRSETPLPLQVDGDYLGERTQVVLRSVPQVLRVVA
ncbi:MAG: diacylglycerol/lipid kinase family protein [Egibacteraceae bacterium]